jgi:hypothetical protein
MSLIRRYRGRTKRRRRVCLAALGLVCGLGCYTQKPSGESAPSTPSAPAAAPEPSPALQAAPPPAPAESLDEKKNEEPASSQGLVPSPAAEPARRAAPAPAKPASKARASSASPEGAAESERAIGGGADDAARDAPVLRQRLDRAYRAGSPDCPSARERKKAVCDLATQICQLTDRDPNVASVAEYCSEAKNRCSQAERRTQERCPD